METTFSKITDAKKNDLNFLTELPIENIIIKGEEIDTIYLNRHSLTVYLKDGSHFNVWTCETKDL